MRIVIALGGNALLKRGEPMTAGHQRANVRVAAQALARVARDHELVISHGNGPQVGLLALQGAAYKDVEAYPLDVLGAETQGMIGYLVEQEVGNLLPEERPLATLLTMVEVDPDDPAFADPTKFVGPIYDEAAGAGPRRREGLGGQARRAVLAARRPVAPAEADLRDPADALAARAGRGRHLRRAAAASRRCTRADAERQLVGVEAVIDKDLASSLLARELGADLFVMATDVDGVYRDWGTPDPGAHRAERRRPSSTAMDLPAGSMGPKVAAAAEFAAATGKRAAIGSLEDIDALVDGSGGTQVIAKERQAMTSLGVHSEVGKLRKVIVHRPDLSLKRLTPGNHDELLFDDVLWVERAQWEHDQFVARMRERGVEVLYVQDLLSEALAASDEARSGSSRSSASEAVVGPSLVEDGPGLPDGARRRTRSRAT